MQINFNIEYRTQWGEELYATLTHGGSTTRIPLRTNDGTKWHGCFKGIMAEGDTVSYYYSVFFYGAEKRREFTQIKRTLTNMHGEEHTYNVFDSWKDIPPMRPFYSSPFTGIFRRPAGGTQEQARQTSPDKLIIKAYCPYIPDDNVLKICGNQEETGMWNTDKAKAMTPSTLPEYEVVLDARKIKFPFEYKFILYNERKKETTYWEDNPNRYVSDTYIKKGESTVIADRYVHFNTSQWKAAGIAIPVFSIRTEDSCGIGDFGDIRRLADWAEKTGMKIIQILPVNDTTATHSWRDSYPYSCISIYALNPVYLSLDSLDRFPTKTRNRFGKLKKELNALPQTDYDRVIKVKEEYIAAAFRLWGRETMQSDDYSAFLAGNRHWLIPYAAFCTLRDRFQTADFTLWKEYAEYDEEKIKPLFNEDNEAYEETSLHLFTQYLLDKQLREAVEYAHAKGIVLKGDIPIGVNRCSVETWTEKRYFNTGCQAGAPPDDFAREGQNWGFPIYDWNEMGKDDYLWWRNRMSKMAEYFDAYRIDHILGFFRIWEIPCEYTLGIMGHFSPALPLSKEEIEGFGLPFKEELFTQPHITNESLNLYVGKDAEKVKSVFLELDRQKGIYKFRKAFDTQRKISAYFDSEEASGFGKSTKAQLLKLSCNVLFLKDPYEKGKYHPRIDSQKEEAYQRLLNDAEKKAYNRLYEHFFYNRHNRFWKEQAMKKLPGLTDSTAMLACGEDLGMIPDCVPETMRQLQILSLEVQRMPKQFGTEFGIPGSYPYYSVCTISTHDTSTLRGWWQEDKNRTKRFYNNILGYWGEPPEEATPQICEEIVKMHLKAKSLLCILTLQDWLSTDEDTRNPDIYVERINDPANHDNYWRYRMHVNVEKLIGNESLCNKIRKMIRDSGR